MGKKILLADDSITIQKVIELTFSDEDFEVVTVGNGRLAIERVLDVRPDIVLCDIIMPEKDGYEVCDFIKKTPTLAHVPVLLLTGAFEPFDQERAARVGCDGFLAKPFEPQTLIAKVKELLSQAAARPAAASPRPVAPPAPPPTVVSAPQPPAMSAPPPPPSAPPPPAPVYSAPPPVTEPVSAFTQTAPPESEVSFIPDEPFLEYPEPAEANADAAAAAVPGAPPDTLEPDLYGVVDAVDAAPDELLTVTAEESATLGGAPSLGVPPDADPSATLVYRAGAPPPWQTTMEVSLETRARAGVESIQRDTDAGIFEEVFEEETLNLKGPVVPEEPTVADLGEQLEAEAPLTEAPEEVPWEPMDELDTGEPAPFAGPEPAPAPPASTAFAPAPPAHVAPPTPAAPAPAQPPAFAATAAPTAPTAPVAPPPPPTPPRVAEAAPAVPAATSAQVAAPAPEVSFADISPAVATPRPEPVSSAVDAGVPADMVEQIAQRVVARISEKVVREIAWEVIPDLAEALIKKEIERLKAELQHT
jgi:CheY-like chemotaxis protein